MVQRLLSLLTLQYREGRLYQVDTRLRPSGNQGPLVVSEEALLEHHARRAQLWERQALVKARAVAGDVAYGERLLGTALAPLVWERPLPDGAAEEIHRLRMRMEREVAGESVDQLNPKTGQGGLVDVEFATQYLQLLHGAVLPAVRQPGTLDALAALAARGKAAPGGRRRAPRGLPLPPPAWRTVSDWCTDGRCSTCRPADDRCCSSPGGWGTADRTPAVRSCRSTARSQPPCARPTSVSSSSERGRKDVQVAPTDPVHVLVVDDDRNVQRMLADALTRAGFRVTVERDGEAALAAFERQSVRRGAPRRAAPGAERLRGRPAHQEHPARASVPRC